MRTSRSLKEVSLELQQLSAQAAYKTKRLGNWDMFSDDMLEEMKQIVFENLSKIRQIYTQLSSIEEKLYSEVDYNGDLTSQLKGEIDQLQHDLRELDQAIKNKKARK